MLNSKDFKDRELDVRPALQRAVAEEVTRKQSEEKSRRGKRGTPTTYEGGDGRGKRLRWRCASPADRDQEGY